MGSSPDDYRFGITIYGNIDWSRERDESEYPPLCDLLRDLFGPLPFRPVAAAPDWRTPTVLGLARAAYEERQLPSGHLDRARLAVLADALEEAGCQNEEVLAHLHAQQAVHVRGCWVLDLLLAKM